MKGVIDFYDEGFYVVYVIVSKRFVEVYSEKGKTHGLVVASDEEKGCFGGGLERKKYMVNESENLLYKKSKKVVGNGFILVYKKNF